MFFQSLFLLCVSSVCCRLLPGEFFPLLCSLAWLALAFFRSGLLCTAELRFLDPFFGPCSHIVGMCSCKARRFVEALRSSWIFNFALFFCFLPLSFGLVCSAPQSCGFRTGFFGPCSHILGMCSCKARRFVEALRSSWIFNFALFFCFLPLSFGLVCSAPQSCGFRTGFFGPCSHILGMCSCKARRFVEALRSSWIFNFALFFCFRFFWSGLLCSAQLRFLQLRTCSKL